MNNLLRGEKKRIITFIIYFIIVSVSVYEWSTFTEAIYKMGG